MAYPASLLLLLACFVVPEHFPPWTAYHTEVPAFAAATVALFIGWRDAGARVPISWLGVPVVLLVLTVLLQLVAGQLPYAGDAWVAGAYLLLFGAACWWGAIWADRCRADQLVDAVAWFLLVAGLILTFQMYAQWLQVEGQFAGWVIDRPAHGRPYGNLGQPNQAATLLIMACTGALLLATQKRIPWRTAAVLLLLFSWAIVLTQSRTALLSATLLAVLMIGTAPKHWRGTKIVVGGWLLAVYAATWVFHVWSPMVALPGVVVTAPTMSSMASVGLRPLLWTQLLSGLMQSPWLGWGWLQIPAAQQAGALSVAGPEQTNYAHNAILDLLLMVGLPVGLSFLLWLLAACRPRLRRVLAHERALSLSYVLLPFCVHAMLEFPHAYAYYLVLAGVMLGAIEVWTRSPAGNGPTVPRGVLGVAALVLSVSYLVLAVDYAQVEEDFRVNRFENRRLGTTPSDYRPPTPWMLTQYGELLAAMRLRPNASMASEDLALLERVSRRFSWAPMHFRAALALALNEQPDAAQRQLQILKAMYPAETYQDARDNWLRMQAEQYPQLARVSLP